MIFRLVGKFEESELFPISAIFGNLSTCYSFDSGISFNATNINS